MKIHVIFGQRHCRYEGEYAPEALEIIDEYGNDDNPGFLIDALAKHRKSNEFSAVEVVNVEVDEEKIHKILNPSHDIVGKIK